MRSQLGIMHRYLKSREITDENAGLLASLIEAGRGIDAVELDPGELKNAKTVLGFSELSYCLVKVDNHLLLLYPTEQREMYFDVRPQLELGAGYAEFPGFSYSEAVAARDLLQAAGVNYHTSVDGTGRVTYAVRREDTKIMRNVVDTVLSELDTPEGRDHFISQNLCWQHAVNQASTALSYGGVSYIGSEGGSSGIRIDEHGAVISIAGKKGRFIPRGDRDFNKKVLSAVMDGLKGDKTPVKAFYGEFADIMTADMTPRSAKLKPMSKNEALDILGMDGIPDIEGCAKLYEDLDSMDRDEETAFYTLLRMSMCRQQKAEEISENRIARRDEEVYQKTHTENVDFFAGFSKELGGEAHER